MHLGNMQAAVGAPTEEAGEMTLKLIQEDKQEPGDSRDAAPQKSLSSPGVSTCSGTVRAKPKDKPAKDKIDPPVNKLPTRIKLDIL